MADNEKQETEQEKEGIRRGWVLFYSALIEMVIIVIPSIFSRILGVSGGWARIITVGQYLAVLITGFSLIYFWWARRNLFFTFVPEGRVKIVVRGDEVRKILLRWRGHILAAEASEGEDIDVWDVIEGKPPKRFFGGLIFYGWWPLDDIYVFKFGWTNMALDGKPQVHPKKTIDYVLTKEDLYLAVVTKAEDKNLLPVDISIVLPIRVINPYKAVFVVQNWLETVMNRIISTVRNTFTEDSYKNWISLDIDLADRIINRMKDFLERECKKHYGIEVRAVEVRDIDPGEEYRKATLQKYLAEREKEAIIVRAEAEKKRIETVYETIQKYRDLGKLVQVVEALKESPKDGTKWIIPLPGMSDILSKVFSTAAVSEEKKT